MDKLGAEVPDWEHDLLGVQSGHEKKIKRSLKNKEAQNLPESFFQ